MRWWLAVLVVCLLIPSEAQAKRKTKEERKQRKQDVQAAFEAAMEAEPKWEYDFFFLPEIGIVGWNDGSTVVGTTSLGAQFGNHYWKPKSAQLTWSGTTRFGTSIIVSDTSSGGDLHLGTFMGPSWRYFSLQVGPDLSYSVYNVNALELENSAGLSFPFLVTFPLKSIALWASIDPALMTNGNRRIDWGNRKEFGFGDEFTTQIGASFAIWSLSLNVAYETQQVKGGKAAGIIIGGTIGG